MQGCNMLHQSVYASLTKLCEALVQNNTVSSHLERSEQHRLVKKLRTNAFAVLLKKKALTLPPQGLPLDAVLRLRFHTFTLHQRGLQKQVERLHGCVDKVIRDGLTGDTAFTAALLFLLSYVENSPEEVTATQDIYQNYLDEFKLPYNNSYSNVRPYRDFSPDVFVAPQSLLEQGRKQANYASYQFLPAGGTFPFSMEPGTDLPLLSRFIRKPKVDSHRYVAPSSSETAFSIPELSSPRGLQIPKLAVTSQELMKDEGYGTPSQEFADVEEPSSYSYVADPVNKDVWDHMHFPVTSDLHTWESVGKVCVEKEPRFLLELSPGDLRHVCMVQMLEQLHSGGTAPALGQPRYLQRSLLLSHLKYLAAGIESTTFVYNQDKQVFELEPGLCLDGMAPTTFSLFCEDFLACGTLCHKLHDLVCADKPTQGLVYRAACRTVRAYIVLYRHAVLSSRACSLVQLRALLDSYSMQLACVNKVLSAGPGTGPLLACLCQQLLMASRPDLTCLLFSLLLSCCRTYFSLLEKWMFEGACSDTYQEFFIQAVPEFQCSSSRSYWNRGFSLDDGEVPAFLLGLQDSILQCAKTIALLKRCNPKDSLCVEGERGHLRVQCCLTKESLVELEAKCKQYKATCRQLCGEPVSVSQLLQRSELDLHAIQEAQRNRLLTAQRERERQAVAQRERKRQLLEDQRQQIEVERAAKKQQAQCELEDARLLDQHQRHEEQRLLQLERKALVEYYDALSEVAERRRKDAEMKIEAQELPDNVRQSLNTSTVLPSPNNNSQENVLNIANIVHTSSREHTLTDDYVNNPIITTPNGNVHFPDLNSNSLAVVTQHTEDVDNSNMGVDLICHKLDASEPRITVSNININAGVGHKVAPSSPHKRVVPDSLPLGQALRSAPTHELSEAQRNKHRVLHEKFGMGGGVMCEAAARRKKHTTTVAWTETDMERNRNRVLQSSIDIGVSSRGHLTRNTTLDTVGNIPATFECERESRTSKTCATQGPDIDLVSVSEELETSVPQDHCASDGDSDTLTRETDVKNEDTHPDGSMLHSESMKESDVVQHDDAAAQVTTSPSHVKSTVTKTELLKVGEHFGELPTVVDLTGSVVGGSEHEVLGQESADMFFILSALRKSVLAPLKVQTQLANSQILHLLLVEGNLLSHLQSLHCFFFLLDGEFCRSVTCDLFERMYRAQRPSDLLNVATLSAVLARAMCTASTPNGSHLSFRVSAVPEVLKHASPSVLGSLSFHYHISWPLNIVVTDASLDKYNMVFGLLLKLQRLSWVMEQDFYWLKGVRLTGQVDRTALLGSPQYHRLQLWRHHIVHVACALQGYLLSALQHECWEQFQRALQSASTLDQICRLHALYLRDVLRRCFLDAKSHSMESALQNLCRVVLKFHGLLRFRQWSRSPGERAYTHPAFHRLGDTYKSFCHLCNFVHKLCLKIATGGYQTHVFCLLQALSMNDYYGDDNQADVSSTIFRLQYVYELANTSLESPVSLSSDC